MTRLDDIEQLQKLINENTFLLIEFGTLTCNPCSDIKDKIEKWIKFQNNENFKIKFIYFQLEKNKKIGAYLNVFSAPTIILFINNKITIRESGYFSLNSIFNKIERYLELYYN